MTLAAVLPLIIPALVPVFADGVRAIVGRVTRGPEGARPQTVDEAIRLSEADTERVKALAALDAPAGNISPWVADLRASFRYIAASVILGAAIAVLFVSGVPPASVDRAWLAAESSWSFIFGDRMYTYLKRGT